MSAAKGSSAKFHLTSPDDFFYCLRNTLTRYKSDKAKRVEDLFFLVMGLTHLREWIAPGYKHEMPQTTAAHKLYHDIYETPEFQIVQSLCNGLKHVKDAPATSYSAGLAFDDWPDVDSVVKWDDGPPTAFYVDGEEVGEILQRLIDSYQREWFSKI